MSKERDHSVADQPKDYDVGYRKPPAASRFKKGVSGNPKGRPPRRHSSEAEEVGKKQASPDRSASVSDQDLLRMVKARKLTWQALVDLYLDERAQERRGKGSKRGRSAETNS